MTGFRHGFYDAGTRLNFKTSKETPRESLHIYIMLDVLEKCGSFYNSEWGTGL